MSKIYKNIWEKEATVLNRKLKINQARRWSFKAMDRKKG